MTAEQVIQYARIASVISHQWIMRLSSFFFERHTALVAQDLLGKILAFNTYRAIITETEAYRGQDDPASHAYKGPTPRSSIMFGPPGHLYVYLIYGIHHCLNIVCESEGNAGAVLIRGLTLIKPQRHLLVGPGKICRYLSINKQYNNLNVCQSPFFWLEEGLSNVPVTKTPRIGLKKGGKETLWRFLIKSPLP